MNIISCGFPTTIYPQWECFERDQAEALAVNGHKVIVAYQRWNILRNSSRQSCREELTTRICCQWPLAKK